MPGKKSLLDGHSTVFLLLAKSFQIASYSGKPQPGLADVEIAARVLRDHVEPIHAAIVDLIPSNKLRAAFRYGKIQAKMQDLIDTSWKRVASDTSFTKEVSARSSNNSFSIVVRPHELVSEPVELPAIKEPVELMAGPLAVEADSRPVYPGQVSGKDLIDENVKETRKAVERKALRQR